MHDHSLPLLNKPDPPRSVCTCGEGTLGSLVLPSYYPLIVSPDGLIEFHEDLRFDNLTVSPENLLYIKPWFHLGIETNVTELASLLSCERVKFVNLEQYGVLFHVGLGISETELFSQVLRTFLRCIWCITQVCSDVGCTLVSCIFRRSNKYRFKL